MLMPKLVVISGSTCLAHIVNAVVVVPVMTVGNVVGLRTSG